MKKNNSKKKFWTLIYLFLAGNLILLVSEVKSEVVSKDFKIYAFDLISDSWCEREVREEYWGEDLEALMKKLMNKIIFLNVRNIIDNPSDTFKVKEIHYFSDYVIVDLSKEFSLLSDPKNELYYLGSYLYFLKNNFPKIKEVKFLINGYDFNHLAGLYDYQHFFDLTKLEPLIFPVCS